MLTREDLLGIELDMPDTVSMHLKCGRCGHTARYTCESIYVDLSKKRGDDTKPEDYVSFGSYFRCKKCESGWPWEFTSDAMLSVTAMMAARVAGLEDERLQFATTQLFDGTPMRSLAQGEDHLLSILEEDPTRGYVWNRLGNIYGQADMHSKALEAYTRALALDPDDFESHYSIGHVLFHRGEPDKSREHLLRALDLAKTFRGLPDDDLDEMICSVVATLVEISEQTGGGVLETPVDGETSSGPFRDIRLERYDLSSKSDRRRLAEQFTGRRAKPGDQTSPRRQVRAESKVGRNDPCPCGSGLKYKRCCWGRQ